MFARDAKPQLIEEYVNTGKVRYVLKYFPFLGDESFLAAMAAECAGEQGSFWEYHDLLFSRWRGEGRGTFLPDKLKDYAQELGLDTQAFGPCLDASRYEATVMADKNQGQEKGVEYTPAIFINGKLSGAPRDYAELRAWIEEALASQ